MLKSLPIFIGLRYILAKKDNRFISFTSLISMAGLTLGVLSLIIVLSVFNGSHALQSERTLVVVPHGDIWVDGEFTDWQAARSLLEADSNIEAVSPYVNAEAMIIQRGYHQVSQIKGILPEAEALVSTLDENMYWGSLSDLKAGEQNIILGSEMAGNLRVGIGDSINLIVPDLVDNATSFKLTIQNFTIVGLFNVPFTLDANMAYVHIEDSLSLAGYNTVEEAVHLRLKVADIDNAAEVVDTQLGVLSQRFPLHSFKGEDWSISESSLFSALKKEKIMTGFMLMMIVAIGAFNIISTLIMVVSDKKSDIAILRTMGCSERNVMGIFMVQGVTVGVAGTLLGGLLGLVVVLNFNAIGSTIEAAFASDSLYVLSSLPATLQQGDVIFTCLSALVISFLATLYPAWKASKILPAEVLRYE